jgi:hypothetical protein
MAAGQSMGRRTFIAGAGAAAAAGLAVFGPRAAYGGNALPEVGTWPWPAGGLDPVRTARGSDKGMSGCAIVSFGLILAGLREALPRAPWNLLSPQLASFGNGGGPYGSDCGALLGPSLAMTLVGAPLALRQDFYKWYCGFDFPSTEWDDFYTFKDTVRTVAHSPLCHESRAIWEGVYLRKAYDGRNYDNTRCAKLPRDCTKKAVELINGWKAGAAPAAWAPDAGYKACYDCHTQLEKDRQPGGIHSGKEDCLHCHGGVPEHGGPDPAESR